MSKTVNVTITDGWFLGEDKDLVIDVVDVNGDPQNMTGWTLDWVLRRATGSADTVLQASDAEVTITISNGDGTNDRATIAVARAGTSGLAPGTYAHALRRTDTNSDTVLAAGTVVLQRAAAR